MSEAGPEVLAPKEEEEEQVVVDDWDNVVCLPIIDISKRQQQHDGSNLGSQENLLAQLSNSSSGGDLLQSNSNFSTVQSLTEYIAGVDITRQLPKIRTGEVAGADGPKSRTRRLLHLLNGLLFHFCTRGGGRSETIRAQLKADRDRLFALALLPFDAQNPVHSRCLYTIYSKLTGNVVNGRRRLGPHWEEIGFQGSDPSTDFRGVGLLGLLQLTFFVVTPAGPVRRLCRAAYDLSLDSRQHYPFAIMAMNISQISLQVLREGLLMRPQRGEVTLLETFNRFYFGVWAAFHEAWTSGEEGGKTILDTGYVLKDLRVYVRRNVNKLASGEYVSLFGVSATSSAAAEANQRGKYDDDQADNFTNIGNI